MCGSLKAQIDTEKPNFEPGQGRPRVRLLVDLEKIQASVDHNQIINTLGKFHFMLFFSHGCYSMKLTLCQLSWIILLFMVKV